MGCAPSTPRSSHPHHPPLRLPVIRPGRADAVAVWFDLWLDGERGEHDIVSTRPEQRTKGEASGWVRLYFESVYWYVGMWATGDDCIRMGAG